MIGSPAVRGVLTQLSLPMPLEGLVYDAINADGIDGAHDKLLYAWEIAIEIQALSCWAVCRQLGIRSATLDAKFGTPAFGNWIKLLSDTRALLDKRRDAVVLPVRRVLDGLEAKYCTDARLAALAERVRAVPNQSVDLRKDASLGTLIAAMPFYRNKTAGHGKPDTEFRRGSVEALREGLFAFCEACPPVGDYRVVVVDRIKKSQDGRSAALAVMAGLMPLIEHVRLDGDDAAHLEPGRPYLHTGPAGFVPLFPAAAAKVVGRHWALGWLKDCGKVCTLRFESSTAGLFPEAVPLADYESLIGAVGGADADADLPAGAIEFEPWRGLLPYDEEHRSIFFGRDGAALEVVSKLERDGAAVLCGVSGCGKSSLARAGVLPRLRDSAQQRGAEFAPVAFVPGEQPIAALRWALVGAGASAGDPAMVARWSREVDEQLPEGSAPRPAALANLLRGLASAGRRVVLLVDQLEELVTICASSEEREWFLSLLTTASAQAGLTQSTFSVLTTVRADKIDALLVDASAREMVERHIKPVGALTRDELLDVVKGPLRGRRVMPEPGLAEEIVADVGDEPGGLALASQVLATLWRERGRFGDRLTKDGYKDAGRVRGVLRREADEAFGESVGAGDDAKERERALELVFLQLGHLGDDGRFTRARAVLAELGQSIGGTADQVETLLAPFLARRLLVIGAPLPIGRSVPRAQVVPATKPASTLYRVTGVDPTSAAAPQGDARPSLPSSPPTDDEHRRQRVEVAHEELLRGWPHLADLMRSNRDVVELRQEVDKAAAAWERSERRRELWSDATSRLRRAEELSAAGRLPLADQGIAFLRASRRSVRRAAWRARAVALGLLVLAVAAGIASWMLRAALARAEDARHRAMGQRIVAEAKAMDATGRPDAALALLRAAADLGPQERAAAFAAELLPRLHDSVATAFARQRGAANIVISPDTETLLRNKSPHGRSSWELVDARSTAIRQVFPDGASILFSPDGRTVASISSDPGTARSGLGSLETLQLWEAASGRLVQKIGLPTELPGASLVAFSPDTTRIIVQRQRKDSTAEAMVLDVASGIPVATIAAPRFGDVQVSRAAELVVSGAAERSSTGAVRHRLSIWSGRTGALLQSISVPPVRRKGLGAVPIFWISEEGVLAVAEGDSTVRLRRGATGELLHELSVPELEDMRLSPDGTTLATVSAAGGAILLWDVTTGQTTRSLGLPWSDYALGHRATIAAMALSADSALMAFALDDGTVHLVHAASGKPLSVLGKLESTPRQLWFSPDGTRLVTVSEGFTRIWSLRDSFVLPDARQARTDGAVLGLGPTGLAALRKTLPGGASVVAVRTVGGADATLEAPDVAVERILALKPSAVATLSRDASVVVWDLPAGKRRAIFTGAQLGLRPGYQASVKLSEDGTLMAVKGLPDPASALGVSAPVMLSIWDTGGGGALFSLEVASQDDFEWSPNSRMLAVGAQKGVALKEARSGRNLAAFDHIDVRDGVVFSPASDFLATADRDGVCVWRGSTGELVRRLRAPDAEFRVSVSWVLPDGYRTRFSPDGRLLMAIALHAESGDVGNGGGGAYAWDVNTGELLATLRTDGGPFSFAADGRRVAIGVPGQDLPKAPRPPRIEIWELPSGVLLQTIGGGDRRVLYAQLPVFSADGLLVAAENDGTLGLWRTPVMPVDELAVEVGTLTNLRVCRDSLTVVAAEFGGRGWGDAVWADPEGCSRPVGSGR